MAELSLLLVTKVLIFWHFVEGTHKGMITLIFVMLPSKCFFGVFFAILYKCPKVWDSYNLIIRSPSDSIQTDLNHSYGEILTPFHLSCMTVYYCIIHLFQDPTEKLSNTLNALMIISMCCSLKYPLPCEIINVSWLAAGDLIHLKLCAVLYPHEACSRLVAALWWMSCLFSHH
jgi:hypothetical protein